MVLTFLLSIFREELNRLKMAEKELIAEIKDAEEDVNLTEKTCALLTQQISQMEECEKCEKDRVSCDLFGKQNCDIYHKNKPKVTFLSSFLFKSL